MTSMPLRVVVADDSLLLREGVVTPRREALTERHALLVPRAITP
jgi:hypothetical protein